MINYCHWFTQSPSFISFSYFSLPPSLPDEAPTKVHVALNGVLSSVIRVAQLKQRLLGQALMGVSRLLEGHVGKAFLQRPRHLESHLRNFWSLCPVRVMSSGAWATVLVIGMSRR